MNTSMAQQMEEQIVYHARLGEFDRIHSLIERLFSQDKTNPPGDESITRTNVLCNAIHKINLLDLLDLDGMLVALRDALGKARTWIAPQIFRETMVPIIVDSFCAQDFEKFGKLWDFFHAEMQAFRKGYPELYVEDDMLQINYRLCAQLTDLDRLEQFTAKIPLHPSFAHKMIGNDVDYNRKIVDAMKLDGHLPSVSQPTIRMIVGFNPAYDCGNIYDVMRQLISNDDSTNACRVLDTLLDNDQIKLSNFNFQELTWSYVILSEAGEDFLAHLVKREQRLLEIAESFLSKREDEALSIKGLNVPRLREIGTGPEANIGGIRREVAIHLAELGANTLGRLYFLKSTERITKSHALIKAAQVLGAFSAEDLKTLYRNSSKDVTSFAHDSCATHLGAFLRYAMENDVELPWADARNPDGIRLTSTVQLQHWYSTFIELNPQSADRELMLAQLDNALNALPAGTTLSETLDEHCEGIDPQLIQATTTFRRRRVSMDFGL